MKWQPVTYDMPACLLLGESGAPAPRRTRISLAGQIVCKIKRLDNPIQILQMIFHLISFIAFDSLA